MLLKEWVYFLHQVTSVTANPNKKNKSSKKEKLSQLMLFFFLWKNFGDDDYHTNDQKRTVQTEKEKKWNAIKTLSTKITNQLNNEDFEKVWENLQ